MYDTKKDISFWQTQYFVTVDTIDKKLEELTESLLKGEMENLNIAASIDEIQGLIVDIYRQIIKLILKSLLNKYIIK